MIIKKYILFLVVSFVGFCLHAQNTHQLIGTAGSISNGLGLTNGIDNISWTIGEVVVFNEDAHQGGFSIAQSMQSYPPFVPKNDCPIVTVKSNNVNLCETNSFATRLTYSFDSLNYPLDSVQWLFSEVGGDPKTFSKIQGATSTSSNSYQPFFPGFYAVSLKFKGSSCNIGAYSVSVPVKTLASPIGVPQISASGSPISLLTASASNGYNNASAISLQWYVYVEPLKKYLMIAGGDKPSQKIRYTGTYMVVATYSGGCRLSSTFDVLDSRQSILRTTDFRIEGNTIYIPDEEAPENSALSVYPNPTLGDFVVTFQSTDEITANLQLYSNTGVFIKEIKLTDGSAWSRSARVGTDDLSAGVYFLKVNQEGKQLVQKVVVYK